MKLRAPPSSQAWKIEEQLLDNNITARCGSFISGLHSLGSQHPSPNEKNLVQLRSGPEKGVITKGVFSQEESLESLKSLNSLESLENGRLLLCFPRSRGSLKSLNSLESLENRLFSKDPFPKDPLFRTRFGPHTFG